MTPTNHSAPHDNAGAAPDNRAHTLTFKDLPGISEGMLAVLERNGFITPTPIQSRVISQGIAGKDIIGIAQTGTGKTLGFGIPMIERILADKAMKRDSRGLVVLPTRELALQVDETLRKIGATPGMSLGIHTAVLIGGEAMGKQVRAVRLGPDIVIATPGRLIDHLEQGTINLDRVSTIVLDEADHMLDIGFMPQIREIIKRAPKDRQTLLFSATMPDEIAKLAMEHMRLPLRIEVAPQGTSAATVEQEIIIVDRRSKFALLKKTLGDVAPGTPILVFSRTKYGAKDIARGLRSAGITAAEIHSNRSLGQRREALDGFKKHKYQVLVATDIAARGIDVKDIGLVVNYDLPEQSEDYVHRIGRTGRAGKAGKAISFASPDQRRDVQEIERLIRREIPRKSHEGAVMEEGHSDRGGRFVRGGFRGGSRGGRGGHSGRGGGFGSSSGFRASPGGHSESRGHSFSHSGSSDSHGGPRVGSYGTGGRGPRSSGGSRSTGGPRSFRSKYPRPLKTDPSKKESLGTGYRRVFRKGVR
ncbi:MAG: DEAD/DEAH box helicase [Patescibacteria group bacterium]|nr:DEAD/DEAH box helicase [Patescibacteria group bacterium]